MIDAILQCHDITKSDFVLGQGSRLTDSQGKIYLDFESGIWCAALGHNHPRVSRVLHQQIDQLMHLGTRYPHAHTQAAAQAVLEITGMEGGKCVFLCSGSEAVEFAVQAARSLSDARSGSSRQMLTLADSFLGSFGSSGKKRPDEWHLLDWRACQDCPQGGDCDPHCDGLKDIPFERMAAFVLEPGSASGWVRFPPAGLVRGLAERVQAAGGLVIVNEVTTGMGRTGQWFGFQHYPGLRPDMVALGKGLGNGYPVSCVAMTPQAARALENSGFRYAQSHQNDPPGCAVAHEVIATLRDENLVDRSRRVGAFFLAELQKLAARHPVIQAVRGRGLMLALELDPAQSSLSAAKVYHEMLERGFLVGISSKSAANFVRFDPPLIVTEEEICSLVANLDEVLFAQKGIL